MFYNFSIVRPEDHHPLPEPKSDCHISSGNQQTTVQIHLKTPQKENYSSTLRSCCRTHFLKRLHDVHSEDRLNNISPLMQICKPKKQ